MRLQKSQYRIVFLIFLILGAFLLGTHISTPADRVAQCNKALQSWQTNMRADPNLAGFSDILQIYKVLYSKTKQDCIIATYLVIKADSPVGQDMAYLEIDSLEKKGSTYWWNSYPAKDMNYSQGTKILDEQLTQLQ